MKADALFVQVLWVDRRAHCYVTQTDSLRAKRYSAASTNRATQTEQYPDIAWIRGEHRVPLYPAGRPGDTRRQEQHIGQIRMPLLAVSWRKREREVLDRRSILRHT